MTGIGAPLQVTNPSLASFAFYFRIGLEVGVCEPEQVRDWAISVIDRMATPPGEIIEISWRKPLAQLIADLKEVEGEPDAGVVGAWLLGQLLSSFDVADDSFGGAVRQAMGIAYAVGDSDLYFIFDSIDDALHLARTQVYGTVAECRNAFHEALKAHGKPPFSFP